MSALQPETKRILGIMLREVEQTLLPDATSPHARTVAHLIGQGLRNLITREDEVPQLLDQWSRIEADLISRAGASLPAVQTNDRVAYNAALTSELESLVAVRVTTDKGELDEFCKSAVKAEQSYFVQHAKAVEAVTVPQRSAERSALLTATPERLTEYFSRKLAHLKPIKVASVTPILSGFSKESMLVEMEAGGKPMPVVLRRDLRGGSVDGTVVDEYPLVSALHRMGLPVPEPVLLETDASIFGEPFTVTRRAPGVVATNPMGGLVGSPEQVNAAKELGAFLARMHQINLRDLGLRGSVYESAATVRDSFVLQIQVCERYYRNHHLQASPTVAAAIAWLHAHIPDAKEAPRLVHGDAGLNNMLIDGDKIGAMLDWELAHPGDPSEDVAYTRNWVNQIMPWQDFLAHYYANGGPEYHAEREKFFGMLSDLRMIMYTMRIQDMLRSSEYPQVSSMYASQHYYGFFIGTLAKNLLAG